ncbi:MAG: prepilin-type N-terminal cleavage/methylation domain-containing protein [Planctomycetota bacterium]
MLKQLLRSGPARRRAYLRHGFTIIEILIAIVVLVLGITGIVALFPTAIESGNQTVEDTYSATITQSVVDAISVGLRESRYSFRTQPTYPADRVWTYFLLNHDGVIDAPVERGSSNPNGPEKFDDATNKLWEKDYVIVLPQATQTTPPNTNSLNELTFVFPTPFVQGEGAPQLQLDQRKPQNLGSTAPATLQNLTFISTDPNPSSPLHFFRRSTAEGTAALWFPRVFHLGRYRLGDPNIPTGINTYDDSLKVIRSEYRGEDISAGGSVGEQTIAVDPYPNYSFAFTLKRARVDTMGGTPDGGDGRITEADHFSNSLYELKVYIFKNFDDNVAKGLVNPTEPVPRMNRPVRTFITLVSL